MSSMRTGAAHFGTPEFARHGRRHRRASRTTSACRCAPARPSPTRTSPTRRRRSSPSPALAAGVGAGADFIVQAAGVLSSFNVLSLEKFVMDDQAISMVRALAAPAAADADALAVDVIDEVGPAGHYLGRAHTRRHARDFDRAVLWEPEPLERRAPGVDPAVAQCVAESLAAYEPPGDLETATRRQLDDYCFS